MKKILVIDDDAAILEVVDIVLRGEGYEVITDTGEQVMVKARHLQPDLILLDVWMMGVDGRMVSRQLKEDPATANIPILLMSAHSNAAAAVTEAKADAFLEKPFEVEGLLNLVAHYVR